MLQDTSQILDTSVNDGDVIDLRRPSLFLSNKDKTNTANMFGAGGSFDASASPSSSPPSRSTPIAPPTPNLGGQNTGFGGNMFADANDNSFTNDTPNAMNAGPEDNNTSLIGLNANIMGEGADQSQSQLNAMSTSMPFANDTSLLGLDQAPMIGNDMLEMPTEENEMANVVNTSLEAFQMA